MLSSGTGGPGTFRERGKEVEYPNSIDTVIELRGSKTKKTRLESFENGT